MKEMVAVGKFVSGIMITNIRMLFGYHVAGLWRWFVMEYCRYFEMFFA